MKFLLPMPPTANTLYPGKARRFKSKRYEAWIQLAWVATAGMDFVSYTAPVSVHYECGRPDNRRRDVENLNKALSDFLKTRGILKDDSLIEDSRIRWITPPPMLFGEVAVSVTIESL